MTNTSTALIQYNCIPHYRARVFELLSENPDVMFTVIADADPDTPFLKAISGDGERRIRHVVAQTKILRLPKIPALYWQPDALRRIREMSPGVVIALGSPYSLTAWALAVWCRMRRVPLLLWGHGLLGEEKGPKWWLRKILYSLAHGQLLYGEYARDLLIKKGFDGERLHVVYNSLDYDMQVEIAENLSADELTAFRDSLGVRPDQGLVAFTGRLQPIKKLDLLVRALGILAERGVIVHVAFVGEGTEKARLAKLADDLGIAPQVHFLGESYDERYLGTVLAASDLCVIPSGAGLSIMHAMVFGTPVLIHDRLSEHFPEWEAVIEGETGLFYRYDDVPDMADKIQEAIFPVPVKAKMKAACQRVIAEKYNPHRQVEIFVDAVRKTLRQAGRDA